MAVRGNLAKNLKELRLVFCPQSQTSAGIRSWVNSKYTQTKALNPTFPILVRQQPGASAYVIARFDKGKEVKSEVEGMDLEQFEAQLEKTVNSHATAGWSV